MIIIYILSIIYINFGLDYQTKKNRNMELVKTVVVKTTNKRPKPVNTEPKK